MLPSTGPGFLLVSGAGLLSQDTTTVAMAEAPLPGGIAHALRFVFSLPQWFQITAFILGVLAAGAAALYLWRRRIAIVAWVRARPRTTKIGLAAFAGVVLLGGASFGAVSWDYMQHDNGFCTGCHVMGPAYVRFTQSEHDSLSCHNCHQQSIVASMRQLYLWVAERPGEIGPHAKVPNTVCAQCHITGQKEVWQRIASTAGHRTHLESDSSALAGLQCVTCHGLEVHRFAPVDSTCGQANCHINQAIGIGKMAQQTSLHCSTCHQFTAEVPQLATRDSASGVLRPGSNQCFSCHEMRQVLADFDPARDPHRGTCGMCHNPHTQQTVAEAKKSCATAGCHADWRSIPFHSGLRHRTIGQECTLCHVPHQARVDPSDCAGCHAAVRERAGGRVRPPVPFDTTRISRGSWTEPVEPDRSKGKGDATPRDPPPGPGPATVAAPPDSFPHARHTTFACITCHVTRQAHNRLTFEVPRGCQFCHHDKAANRACTTCHEESEWTAPRSATVRVAVAGHEPRERPVTFLHSTHTARQCAQCHTTPVTLNPEPPAATCQACHDDHHAAARQCRECHGGTDPTPRAAHATLTDMHVACDNCHESATVAKLTPDRAFCATCHGEQQAHYPDQECTTCHFLSSPDDFRPHLQKSRGEGDR
jgi:hypothetical protein